MISLNISNTVFESVSFSIVVLAVYFLMETLLFLSFDVYGKLNYVLLLFLTVNIFGLLHIIAIILYSSVKYKYSEIVAPLFEGLAYIIMAVSYYSMIYSLSHYMLTSFWKRFLKIYCGIHVLFVVSWMICSLLVGQEYDYKMSALISAGLILFSSLIFEVALHLTLIIQIVKYNKSIQSIRKMTYLFIAFTTLLLCCEVAQTVLSFSDIAILMYQSINILTLIKAKFELIIFSRLRVCIAEHTQQEAAENERIVHMKS